MFSYFNKNKEMEVKEEKMSYPAYIYFEEQGDVTAINPVYFKSKEDATYVAEALDNINKLLLTTGYEVVVKKQNYE